MGHEQATNDGERSLDPDDWEALRELGHRAFDDMIEYLQTIRERPAWQPLPATAKALFDEGVPRQGTPCDEVYAQIHEHVLPYPTGNIHPRFWSWVGGTGTATQLIADLVASAMNSAGLGFDEVASSYVELQLLNWLKTLNCVHQWEGEERSEEPASEAAAVTVATRVAVTAAFRSYLGLRWFPTALRPLPRSFGCP